MKLKLSQMPIGLDCWATCRRLLFQGRTYHASKILYHNMKLPALKTLLMITLKVDENSLYSCVGIPGAQAGNEITSEDESHEGFPGVIPMGLCFIYNVPASLQHELPRSHFLSVLLSYREYILNI